MDSDEMLKFQHQMRENNEELNDFLRDLKHWENEMKKKDTELSSPLSDSANLPPIRNQRSRLRKKKKTTPANDNGTKPKTKRIPGSDYSSWDKFDVDHALKELDENDNSRNSSCSSEEPDTEDEELEIERRKQQAIIEKDKGNDFFKEGKYDEAICCYTSGMNCDPSNALLPANRAMALLKKGSLAAAEKDCDVALSIDPTYTKAYLRRGAARFGLKKLDLARDDFQKALEIDPTNKQAKLELLKTEKELQNSVLKAEEENVTQNDKVNLQSDFTPGLKGDNSNLTKSADKQNGIIMPVNKPPHQRSKKPLVRIEIKEVLSDNEDFECKAKSSLPNIKSEEHPIPKSVKESTHKVTSNSGLANAKQSPVTISSDTINERPVICTIPQTAYQFYTDWRALRKHPLSQCQYLRQLHPTEIPKLFKQSMDAELFSDILKMLRKQFLDDSYSLYQYLKNLSQVGRFGTLVMFLSQEEYKYISDMIDIIKSTDKCTEEEISSLQKSFDVTTN